MDMHSPTDNTEFVHMAEKFCPKVQDSRSYLRRPNFDSFRSGSRTDQEQSHGSVSLDTQSDVKKKQTEFITAKKDICLLQNELSTVNSSRKRARAEHERHLYELKDEHKREVEKYSNLKHELHLMTSKELETKEELIKTQKTLTATKLANEQKVLSMQKELHQLDETNQQIKETLQQQLNDLKHENFKIKRELLSFQDKLKEEQKLVVILKEQSARLYNRKDVQQMEIDAVKSEQKIKELEQKVMKLEEDNVIATAMRSRITQATAMEKENRRLKEENSYLQENRESAMLLREEIEGLKQRNGRLQQQTVELQQSQLRFDEMQRKLEKWEAKDARGVAKYQSPSEMSRFVSELQSSNAVLLEKQGQLRSNLNSSQKELSDKKKETVELQETVTQQQGKLKHLAEQMKRLQRKLLLVTKERDGYKKIIDSYESEVTVNLNVTASQRVAHLEQINAEYHRHVAHLETQLADKTDALQDSFKTQQSPVSVKSLHAPSDVDQKLLASLREKIAELEKRVETITEEKEILEARIERCNSQGDYDPTKTKVVHLSMNPVAEAQRHRAQQLKKLQEENERLKKRLAIVEESGGEKVEDLTTLVEDKLEEPSTSKELTDMKQQLTSAELKNKRLMEAFSKTSREFREVCYRLLGYKLDIPVSNQYRLLSMYADSPHDYLLFQQSDSADGDLRLLDTAYSSTLHDKIQTYLAAADSIPAFLSSLTLELFQSQTMIS